VGVQFVQYSSLERYVVLHITFFVNCTFGYGSHIRALSILLFIMPLSRRCPVYRLRLFMSSLTFVPCLYAMFVYALSHVRALSIGYVCLCPLSRPCPVSMLCLFMPSITSVPCLWDMFVYVLSHVRALSIDYVCLCPLSRPCPVHRIRLFMHSITSVPCL